MNRNNKGSTCVWQAPRILRKAGFGGLALSGCLIAATGVAQNAPSAYTTNYIYSVGGLLTGTIRPYSGSGAVSYLAMRNTYNSVAQLSKVENGTLSAWPSTGTLPVNWSGFTVSTTITYTYDSIGNKLSATSAGSNGRSHQRYSILL